MKQNRISPRDLFYNSALLKDMNRAVYYRGHLVVDIHHADESNFALGFADGSEKLVSIEAEDCLVIVEHNSSTSVFLNSAELAIIESALQESLRVYSEELSLNYRLTRVWSGHGDYRDDILTACKQRRQVKRALAILKRHGR